MYKRQGTGSALTLDASSSFEDASGASYPAGTGLVVQPGSAAHTIAANIDLGSSQTWEINNSGSNPLTVSGVIGNGAGSDSLTITGVGELILSSPETYSGGTIVEGGTLALGVSNALLTTGNLTVTGTGGSGGTFNLAGFNQTVGSLSDGGARDVYKRQP